MKKPKKQLSQGDQKMKEYHEGIQRDALCKIQEANPVIIGKPGSEVRFKEECWATCKTPNILLP